jgi:pimeloyl-ACP methyl ester carboxylesterase
MAATQKFISTPNGRTAVRDSGNGGFPVLMLHGSGASQKVFSKQFDSPLASKFRLIAIDLPGHGDSDDASDIEGYSLPGLADTVGLVIEALGLRQMAVLGWSLGGHVAIELMARHAAISGLMLTGAPPVSKGPLGMLRGFHTGWDMLLASKANFTERDALHFARMCFGDEPPEAFVADIRRADGRCRARFVRSMMAGDGADQRRTMESTVMPVAMVAGVAEKIVRVSYLSSLNYPMLWGDKVQMVEGAGHSPFWQNPDRFNLLLGRFAGEVAQRAALAPVGQRVGAR